MSTRKKRIATRTKLVVLPNTSTPADRSAELRRIRRHQLLGLLRQFGPLSRSDLVKHTGYNQPNVSTLVDELVAEGLVRELEARPSMRGRRPTPVCLETKAAMVLGVEVGKERTVGILVDLGGEILARVEEPAKVGTNGARVEGSWLSDFMNRVLSEAENQTPPLTGVGVSVPESVEMCQPGACFDPLALAPGSKADLLRQRLEGEFGIPVLVNNETRMMATGSAWFGCSKSYTSYSYLNLSDHPGAALVFDGRISPGVHGLAGQFNGLLASIPEVSGPACMESTLSPAGVANLARDAKLRNTGDLDSLLKAIEKGNDKAVLVQNQFAVALSQALAAIISLTDPEAAILGGDLAPLAEKAMPKIREELGRLCGAESLNRVQLHTCDLGRDARIMGAAAAVLQRVFTSCHIRLEEML
ncbi:ROK family transcriptional regulator [Candidatus Poribacteria bacterium]|nr:ROK family transcriptional regulator [Candidatus Poribacteria bacterium]